MNRNLCRPSFWLPASMALLLLMGLLAWALSSTRPAPSGSLAGGLAKVTFASYSNAPDGRVFAWFCVTNPSDYKILHFRPRVQGRFGSELEGLHLLDCQAASKLHGPWALPPHTRIWVNVTKPANEPGWRVSVMNGVPRSGLKTGLARVCQWLPFVSRSFSQFISDNTGTTFYASTSEERTD